MIWIKRQDDNPEVTNYYLDIIAKAYGCKGEKVNFFTSWNDYKPDMRDIVVVSNHREALKMAIERKKYVYWVQGITPEEDYARFHKRTRKFALEIVERIGLKHATFVLFVSKYMKVHYEKKYNMKLEKYYIMPCNNDVIHTESFYAKDKYNKNVFCYAGGLDVWQCIEETLELYKIIEDKYNNSKLLLLVKNKEKAEELIKKYRIRHFEIDFVAVDKLPEKLKTVKFGFLIRDDIELNRVATPTKLMTYMGNGVIPIMSDCLVGLKENLKDTPYVISITDTKSIAGIEYMMTSHIEASAIYKDYEEIYNKYYNQETHIKNLKERLPVIS